MRLYVYNLQYSNSACIFVSYLEVKLHKSYGKTRGAYEADTKGSRRVAEEFYTYIVS
jgi:hypothetical protein